MEEHDYEYTPEMNNRFYLIRTALGKTQKEMGPPLGYSPATFSKLEKTGFKVEEKIVVLMCSVYDVSYDYLVYGKGPMFNKEDAERKAWTNLYDALPTPYQNMIFMMVQGLLDRLSKDNVSKDEISNGE